jgi:hypothetical protein
MISVVIRPFKSGGVFYPAGTIVDPAGITLYKSKIGENKIKVVDEHNLEEVARFLQIRHKMDDAQEFLTKELRGIDEPKLTVEEEAYLVKVKLAAKKYAIDMEGKTTEQVVAEVKVKQKAASEKK